MSRIEEYDDGYDSAESFERAGADQPEHVDETPTTSPTIERVLTVSMLHIPESLQEALLAVADPDSCPFIDTSAAAEWDAHLHNVCVDAVTYGFYIWVGDTERDVDCFDAWPEPLKAIARMAHRLDCSRVMIDRDEQPYAELTQWPR